ncbi:sigma 54-interacting transcriptional regulator [Thalassorhabdus alkalitolerans]|uniref:Sigma 54-interacting transcriptional regulator n=1 Tax=Thalassorhabdus alkalitolerans TaxID=2282697 RepID=A0ABW0YMM6_9BACI|nr:sigma 54-interacting transcriptional regulator [Thalassobacillus sp. C254]
MEDVVVITPFAELAERFEGLRLKTDVPFSLISLEKDLKDERDLPEKVRGAKVLISRGGTARLLREKGSVPVIDIPVSVKDVLRSVSSTVNKGFTDVAVVTPENLLTFTENLSLSKDAKITFESYQNKKQIKKKIESLIEKNNVKAVIGDKAAVKAATKLGVFSELLLSGEEALHTALDTAQHLLSIQRNEQAKRKELEAVIHYVNEGVITVNEEGRITVFNEAAKHIFKKENEEVTGRDVRKAIPEAKDINIKKEQRNKLLQGKRIIYTTLPIYIDGNFQGSVLIFEETKKLQKLELEIRKELNKKGLTAKHRFTDIVTKNKEMKEALEEAALFAASEGTVVIYGESGTGKELVAQSIHNASEREEKPFVSINCASLSPTLLESELFGYEEGAFTGAVKGGKPGLFELAHRGTLFLDEIGEISLEFQAKLLRVLQEKEVKRIGGGRITPVDVRVICATNQRLSQLVEEEKFREDLYYRLAILEVELLPLRERKEDIVPLALSFLEKEKKSGRKPLRWQSEDVFSPLLAHKWKGNARELENFVHRLVLLSPAEDISKGFVEKQLNKRPLTKSAKVELSVTQDIKLMEKELWEKILDQYDGDKEEVCRQYRISKSTLWRKLSFNNEK